METSALLRAVAIRGGREWGELRIVRGSDSWQATLQILFEEMKCLKVLSSEMDPAEIRFIW